MGLIRSIIIAPFKITKKGIVATKNLVMPNNEEIPIIAVVKTNYHGAYEYFFEGKADTQRYKDYLIVWKKGTKEDVKKKILKEIGV